MKENALYSGSIELVSERGERGRERERWKERERQKERERNTERQTEIPAPFSDSLLV